MHILHAQRLLNLAESIVLLFASGDSKEVDIIFLSQVCDILCGHHGLEEGKLGVLYKLGTVVTHHFCLMLSSGLQQVWGYQAEYLDTNQADFKLCTSSGG